MAREVSRVSKVSELTDKSANGKAASPARKDVRNLIVTCLHLHLQVENGGAGNARAHAHCNEGDIQGERLDET